MHQSIVRYNDISPTQLICDLNWVFKSPGLLEVAPPQVSWQLLPDEYFDKCSEWIQSIEKDPQKLIDFFNSEQQFILGKYFEKHLQFIFEYFDGFSLIASGLQVEKNKRTIGEIDFIFKDLAMDKIVHLEVAVKYYMGFGSSAKHAMWIGPNGLDSLEGKIQKFSSQLSVAGFAEQLQDLKPLNFNKKVLLKGYFFQHIKTDVLPNYCHPDVLKGKWLFISELDKIVNPESQYFIFPKWSWLGFYLEKNLQLIQGNNMVATVKRELDRVGKGILVAEFYQGSSQIKTRYMVVPNHWPRLS